MHVITIAEVDDLRGGGIVLDTGQVCHLPLIPLDGMLRFAVLG